MAGTIHFALIAAMLFAFGCVSQGNLTQACTEEAKICPDGSAVGRNASLDCEFDPCPNATENTVCTADTKLCEDGTYVGRDVTKNCQFYPCPPISETNTTACDSHGWRECGEYGGCEVCATCKGCDAPSCQSRAFCDAIRQG